MYYDTITITSTITTTTTTTTTIVSFSSGGARKRQDAPGSARSGRKHHWAPGGARRSSGIMSRLLQCTGIISCASCKETPPFLLHVLSKFLLYLSLVSGSRRMSYASFNAWKVALFGSPALLGWRTGAPAGKEKRCCGTWSNNHVGDRNCSFVLTLP